MSNASQSQGVTADDIAWLIEGIALVDERESERPLTEKEVSVRGRMSRLLAALRAGAQSVPEGDDSRCSDCGERPWVHDMESGQPLCHECLIAMQERIIARLEREKPTPVDDPQAEGRVAMLVRDYASDPRDCAKRILSLIRGTP